MRQRAMKLRIFLACAGFAISVTASANPTGPQVIHGQASFSNPSANVLEIANSPGAIINWRGFSIGAAELTRFRQSGATSAVLNRVVGQLPSEILGQLLSNGRVFLINPNGLVIGRDAIIDTAGFTGSTLHMADRDFIEGRMRFEGDADSGNILNQGSINAAAGGVYLIAPNIENSGIVRSDNGDVLLAAGHAVTITSADLQGVRFEVRAPENEAVNLGQLIAGNGTVGVFAGTLRHMGSIEANRVSAARHHKLSARIWPHPGSALARHCLRPLSLSIETTASVKFV